MGINYLVIALMVTYFLCSLLLAYPIGRMAHNRRKGYVFRVKWYHKAASTYILALPIFTGLAFLLGELL